MRMRFLPLMLLCVSAAFSEPLRTWTDKDGKTVDARLVNKDDTHAHVILKNGKTAQLPLNRLSEPDVEYVAAADVNEFTIYKGIKFPQIVTEEKFTFSDVEVLEKLPDSIFIRYRKARTPWGDPGFIGLPHNSITRLPYESLPISVQNKLGGFNPEKAKAYREKEERDNEFEENEHPLGKMFDEKDNPTGFWPYEPAGEVELRGDRGGKNRE